MEKMEKKYKGSCNCGNIRYEVTGPLSDITGCHCGQCRKQTGLYYAAVHVENENFDLQSESTLSWYRASDEAQRGFCNNCGSSLFWRPNTHSHTSILAGTFDDDIPSIFAKHIYCNDKASFYTLTDGVPQFDNNGNPFKV